MKVRLIHTSNEDSSLEEVTFTEDFDVSAEDYCRPNCKVISDTIINVDLPSSFPMESTLVKE